MLDKTEDIAVFAETWLARFESALGEANDDALRSLFLPDSFWRRAGAELEVADHQRRGSDADAIAPPC